MAIPVGTPGLRVAQASGVAPAIARQDVAAAPQISPKARRLAKELGVEIRQIRGTGPDGVITAEDVQAFANAKGAAAASAVPAGAEGLSAVARLMAERTTQSWTSVPHFFLVRDVDCGELVAAQKKWSAAGAKAQRPTPTITDLLIGILARVLAKHPRMNASWSGNGVRPNAEINISVEMAWTKGGVGCVIHKANTARIGGMSPPRWALTEE